MIRRLLRTLRQLPGQRAKGGELHPRRPRPDEQLAILSPGWIEQSSGFTGIRQPENGPSMDAEQIRTNIQFFSQVIGDSRRVIYCQPPMAQAVRDAVEAQGVGGLLTVRPSPICPEGKLILVDEQAMNASLNAAAHRAGRNLFGRHVEDS